MTDTSQETPRPAKMQLVGERRTQDAPRPMTLTETVQAATPRMPPDWRPPANVMPELQARAAWRAGVLGSINVLVRVLAARFIALVATAGAIGLTWLALGNPDLNHEIVLGVYCGAVVVPTVILAAFGR